MAEERDLALARANDTADEDVDQTKAALQRRMEEARESISQTVTEIKDTVVNQYQQVRENISDTLDWREQYKRHTLPFTLTAFAVGAFVGYTVMGAFKGEGEEDYEEDGAFDRIESGFDRGLKGGARSYASQPVLGRAAAAGAYQRVTDEGEDVGPETRPSYSSGYQAPTAPKPQALTSYASAAPAAPEEQEEEEPKGPGLLERFKETKAYDRLQEELSTLGDRALEELSKTARNVVVPALLNKLKGLIGLDLSGQQGGAQQQASAGTRRQSAYSAPTATAGGVSGSNQPSGGAPDAGGTTSASGTNARAATGGTEGYGAS
ncbi:MAG: hypothetical protein JOZ96_06135 [Acidobacteria bacterium]|nr:hypothetical protein [Acidobacteriota bacterium]MBV9924604.1 hypothetical protein [Acidobacteriota bacterium]